MNLIQPGEQLVNIGNGAGWLFDQGLAKPRQQLGSLLEDRQVGGEVGVEHRVEAQAAQRRDHLAGDQRARRIAETLAQGGPDGRRGLHHHEVVGLVQRLPDLFDLILLGDRADGADGRALAALHAGHGSQVAIERRADGRLETAILRQQGPDVLHFGANAHAAAALDALAVVAHQRRGGRVDPFAGLLARIGDLADPQLGRQRLQLAILVAVAGLAIAVVLREQQFDDAAPGLRARAACS